MYLQAFFIEFPKPSSCMENKNETIKPFKKKKMNQSGDHAALLEEKIQVQLDVPLSWKTLLNEMEMTR